MRSHGALCAKRQDLLRSVVASLLRYLHRMTTVHEVPSSFVDDGLSVFQRVRPRLFGIAFRMLSSAAEAEDIVQDVWIRWQTTDRSPVRSPPAFLVAATVRLAINVLHSARARREVSPDSRSAEPIDMTTDAIADVAQGEALNLAVRLLLEKLSPAERGAYVLREAFNYSYREIASILQIAEANARQLVVRAREHVSSGRHATVNPGEQQRLLQTLAAAARTGDVTSLEQLLSQHTAPSGQCI